MHAGNEARDGVAMRAWELLLLGCVAVGLAAAIWYSLRRRPGPAGQPRGGDIWWADVPYTDGTGSKVRPCLVLLRHRRGIVVLKITSQDKSHRRDHVLIPTKSWDPWARHDSYLNLGEPIIVRRDAFERRAGACDPAVLKRIARSPGLLRRDLSALAASAR
jgi:mRNA-degrading endonuclease toxin of MazEF toxin-antitoxin module